MGRHIVSRKSRKKTYPRDDSVWDCVLRLQPKSAAHTWLFVGLPGFYRPISSFDYRTSINPKIVRSLRALPSEPPTIAAIFVFIFCRSLLNGSLAFFPNNLWTFRPSGPRASLRLIGRPTQKEIGQLSCKFPFDIVHGLAARIIYI